MVDPVSSTPYYSYLNALQGVHNAPQLPGTSATNKSSSPGNNASSASAAISSLLGGNALAPEILSLLQNNGSGSFDPVSTLLSNGTSTYNPFTTVLSNLYASGAAASLTQAQENATPPASGNPAPTGAAVVESLINSAIQASIAYNNTNIRNVAKTLANDGVTPITV